MTGLSVNLLAPAPCTDTHAPSDPLDFSLHHSPGRYVLFLKQTERRRCSKSAEGRLRGSRYLHDSTSRHTVPNTLPYLTSIRKVCTTSSSVRLSPLTCSTYVNLLGLAHNRHQSVQDKSTDIRVKHLPLGRPGVETIRPNLQVLSLHWLQIPIHAHEHGATSMLRSLAARPCRTYSLNPPGNPASSDECETKRPAGRNTARSHGL